MNVTIDRRSGVPYYLQVKEAVFKLGFVFLMVVVVFVLYNDLSKILPPG